MTAVDAPLSLRPIAPVQSRLRRGLRRYGLPAVGARVILAWSAVAILAPEMSEEEGRALARSAETLKSAVARIKVGKTTPAASSSPSI